MADILPALVLQHRPATAPAVEFNNPAKLSKPTASSQAWRRRDRQAQHQVERGTVVARALSLAAAALRTNQSALGTYFRRMSERIVLALVPSPRRPTNSARLIYTMLTKGEEYTDQGQDYYEERYRERVLRQLSQRAQKLGMKLVATERPA